jgi:epoxyqueuosine reductase
VRGAAVWALAQLVEPAEFTSIKARVLPMESEESVREEWLAAS